MEPASHFFKRRVSLLLGATLLVACLPFERAGLQAATLPVSSEVPLVIRQSVAVNNADWKAQTRYSYVERDINSKSEGSEGGPEDSKTYAVTMIAGSPYMRLIASDGEPLSSSQEDEEKQKLSREILKRQNESSSERQNRISKFKETRAEEHLLMQQMVAAFNFRLLGEEELNGVSCYSFEATPNPEYHPPVEKARVLVGMSGHMWIDKQSYHWVKVKAQVTQPVSFGFFIAKVKPGTSFELEQAPVGDVWLPKRFIETVNASVLGLYGYQTKLESFYSRYKEDNVAARVQPQR